MTTNTSRLGFAACALIIAIVSQGCTTEYELELKPVVSYPTTERLNMNVNLLLENEFAGDGSLLFQRHNAARQYDFYPPAEVLGQSAVALAQAVFGEVHVVNSLPAANGVPPQCAAIVKPHMLKGEDEAGGWTGGVVLYIEWTVTKPNGDLVWKKPIRGECSTGWKPATQAQGALEQIFSASFTNMYQSSAIRALAQSPPAAPSRTGN